ncbi:hypothetical protein HPB47_026137 [Ixodes persulcatus]|uniref:Uncharacterized protein n=1 Tax=Ixodes persulcatus TaxID=34615 RepID=A0AC60PZI1_IXOPE|nr:hypothetical protein HPB47_026137 [Ixodes persulcatus]
MLVPSSSHAQDSIRATPAVSVRAARHGGSNTHLTCPSILQWNARGLRRRLPDLRQHLIHSPADVLAIQEPMTRPGDFRRTTARGRSLECVTSSLHLEALNDGTETYVRRGVNDSVLDLSFAPPDVAANWTPQPDSWGSDHIPINIVSPNANEPKYRRCRVTNWDMYRRHLDSALAAGPLKDPIIAIANALSLSTRTIKVPLWRPAPDLVYLNLRAARRRAQRKARRTKDPKDWNTHHKIDAKFRRHTLRLQRKQWGQLCASFGSPDVRETLPDLPRKKDIHPTVARTAVAVALENEYVEHLEVYTDGSVDKKRGTATAAYTIPAISTESAVLLNIKTSSTTAETVAILMALTALQERPAMGKAVILTDSRSALVHFANPEHAPLIAQEAAHIATKLEDNGWRLVFQWVPSHSGILGNERADTLATRAHSISTTTHNLRRFHEARLHIARDLRKRHPDPGTANGEGAAVTS